jgi:tetraacyldisaccharide 4'-kinase
MAWIERHWQSVTPVSALLYPASLLYGAVVALRRTTIAPERLPVPVIVIGNVTVGGTGKTPLTLWLEKTLRDSGWTPGIVCRGYGGSRRGPQPVLAESDPAACGDEAVLLARRSSCAVWAGADRVATARALLASQPGCNVVLSDDGLQHYALARDVEICVVDAARGFGNGWLLPAGPLREPLSRVATVDAVVVNGSPDALHPSLARLPGAAPRFPMKLQGNGFRNLADPARVSGAGSFRGKRVHAVAGIGNPRRFFSHLRQLGLDFTEHPFPDHHPFVASDLAFAQAEAVVMTEKDAVKCRSFATEMHWELAVSAAPDPDLAGLVLRKLQTRKR